MQRTTISRSTALLVLVLTTFGCHHQSAVNSVPEPQADPTPAAGPSDAGLPADAAPEIQAAVASITDCEGLENLIPVRDAWDVVCQHADAIGAAAAAEILETCRAEHIERSWAKVAPPPDDEAAVAAGRKAFDAGLRDGFEGQIHDLSKPLALTSCLSLGAE